MGSFHLFLTGIRSVRYCCIHNYVYFIYYLIYFCGHKDHPEHDTIIIRVNDIIIMGPKECVDFVVSGIFDGVRD